MFGERDLTCVWREGSSLCLEKGKKPVFGEKEVALLKRGKYLVFEERNVACVLREGSSLCLEKGE